MKKIANSSKKYYEEKLNTYGPSIKDLIGKIDILKIKISNFIQNS